MKLTALLVAAAACAAALVGCGSSQRSAEVHYKVTVQLRDPKSVREGSSVMSWRLRKASVPLTSSYSGEFRGEAIPISLGNGDLVFAILRGVDDDQGVMQLMPERVLGDIGRGLRGESRRFNGDRIADLHDIAKRVGETGSLNCRSRPEFCPMFVRFLDPLNPATVQQVDPFELYNRSGSKLEYDGVTLTVVDEPVTDRIKRVLPWLSTHAGALQKDKSRRPLKDKSIAARLTDGDFWRGVL